jgi:hypothetical protein
MKPSKSQDERIAEMTFASVYPLYVAKVERKGRTKEELHRVITWLTGFDDAKLQELIRDGATFAEFFEKAKLHPNADQVTGKICGYRIEEIENPLTKNVRRLDKLVDELAAGRPLERVLRASVNAQGPNSNT